MKILQHILVLALSLSIANIIDAQEVVNADTIPPYIKYQHIPPFKILETDSATWFTKDSLPKNRPVIIMYFSPDCSHCKYEMSTIVDSMNLVKNAFFVLVSFKSLHEIEEFCDKYKLHNYNNIRAGRDVKYGIPSFYRVEFTPFIAVYNDKGKLARIFRKGATVEELSQVINRPSAAN